MKILERKFSFQSNFVFAFNSWSTYSNGTWKNGLVRDVIVGISQLGICCITIDYDRFKFVDFTSYTHVESIKIFSSPPKLYQNNWVLISPFPFLVWLLIFSSFVVIFLVLILSTYILKPFKSNLSIIWFNLIGISIQQSLYNFSIDNHLTQRQIYTIWLLSSIIFANLYSSELYSVLTVPKYEKAIDTVKDMQQMLQNNERFIRFKQNSYLWSVITKSEPGNGIFYDIKHNALQNKMNFVNQLSDLEPLILSDWHNIVIGEETIFRAMYSTLHISKESLVPVLLALIVAKDSPIRMPINSVYVIFF